MLLSVSWSYRLRLRRIPNCDSDQTFSDSDGREATLNWADLSSEYVRERDWTTLQYCQAPGLGHNHVKW